MEQLTGMDASFLDLETPEMPMHVVGLLLLDPAGGDGYSHERLRDMIEERLHLLAPFRRRLVEVPLGLDRPYWHYEETVAFDQHVHRVSVPAPGDARALGALVGEIATRLLDRSRPLWELWVIDGLADGRVAIVAKVHHATMYGVAGAAFIANLLDLDPQGRTDLPEVDVPVGEEPGTLTLTARALLRQVRWPLAVGRLATEMGRTAASTAGALARVVAHQGSAAMPFMAPRVSISGSLTTSRTVAFTALPLPLVKQVKNATGTKVNDVLLAAVALSLRDYLAARDDLPRRPLVASCPVNAGEGASEGTNEIGAMLVPLPMDVDDPDALLERVAASTRAAKEFTSAMGANTLARIADVTPPVAIVVGMWLSRALRLGALQPPMQNVIVSNVIGPPVPIYMAGARVDAIYPMGPLLPGSGLNITVLTNLDRMDVGIMACGDLVPGVWEVADALPAKVDELAAALGVRAAG